MDNSKTEVEALAGAFGQMLGEISGDPEQLLNGIAEVQGSIKDMSDTLFHSLESVRKEIVCLDFSPNMTRRQYVQAHAPVIFATLLRTEQRTAGAGHDPLIDQSIELAQQFYNKTRLL